MILLLIQRGRAGAPIEPIARMFECNDLHTVMDVEDLWPSSDEEEAVDTGVGFRWVEGLDRYEIMVLDGPIKKAVTVFYDETCHDEIEW